MAIRLILAALVLTVASGCAAENNNTAAPEPVLPAQEAEAPVEPGNNTPNPPEALATSDSDSHIALNEVAAYDAFVIERFSGIVSESDLHGIQILINAHCLDILESTGLEGTFGAEVEQIVESFDQEFCRDVVHSPLFASSPATGASTWEEMISGRFSRVQGWLSEEQFSVRSISACWQEDTLLELQKDSDLSLSAMVEINAIVSSGECSLITGGADEAEAAEAEAPATAGADLEAFRAAIERIDFSGDVIWRPGDVLQFDAMFDEHEEFGYAMNLGVIWAEPRDSGGEIPIELGDVAHDQLVDAGFERTRSCSDEDGFTWGYRHVEGATGPTLVASSIGSPQLVYIAITGTHEPDDEFDHMLAC